MTAWLYFESINYNLYGAYCIHGLSRRYVKDSNDRSM